MNDFIKKLHEAVRLGHLPIGILNGVTSNDFQSLECEVLDFKRQVPETDSEYAKTVRDLVAFHNSYGGFLVFGIEEIEKNKKFSVVGVEPNDLDTVKIRDYLKNYTNEDIRTHFDTVEVNGKLIEVAGVSKRSSGVNPVRFSKNGPDEKPRKPAFKRGEVVYRRLDTNAIATTADDYSFLYSKRRPPSLDMEAPDFSRDEPLEHNLPDRALVCSKFVGRKDGLVDLWTWLADGFSRVRLIAGEGGLGKTSLAYRFSEEVARGRVKPFEQVVWLTAKKKQFAAIEDIYRETLRRDFSDASTLFEALALAHGCVESDLDDVDSRDLMQVALTSLSLVPSFIVIDDIDSLVPEDQQRAFEFGMRAPPGTKILMTTRINLSYSPDNVFKLNGFDRNDFIDYVTVVRGRYRLSEIKESKIDHLREISGGSPLFTDSLLRLECRGLTLDQAINQWKGEKGLEARKAALQREIGQLSREAKRTLYVISREKNVGFVELSQILDYAEQTLGDALQELAGLFLLSAPSIGRESRYTVEPNTGRLVIELASTLSIDHAALAASIKRLKSDAIGLSLKKRSSIVGLAISQGIAFLKKGDPKSSIETVKSAAKQLSKPHPDLLLATGRFSLKLDPPALEQASVAFEKAFDLGQRKQLLFKLWFDTEYSRGRFEVALDVASKAIENSVSEVDRWHERRAQVFVARAHRLASTISADSAIREIDFAVNELRSAKKTCRSEFRVRQIDQMFKQADELRVRVSSIARSIRP